MKKKVGGVGGLFTGSGGEQWCRVFMVLCYTKSREVLLLYYNSKQDFELTPGKPVKARPLDVTGYTVTTYKGPTPDTLYCKSTCVCCTCVCVLRESVCGMESLHIYSCVTAAVVVASVVVVGGGGDDDVCEAQLCVVFMYAWCR
jgi:hypothetical protein